MISEPHFQTVRDHTAVTFEIGSDPHGRRDFYHCHRCGARRFPECGERLPYECVPTPQWLRDHPEEDRP